MDHFYPIREMATGVLLLEIMIHEGQVIKAGAG
jgi:hypothetical protein